MMTKERADDMYQTCLKCPLSTCLPETNLCPYFNKYGREMAPVLMEDFCGIPENEISKKRVAKRISRA